ncbi:hypothetical protein [Pseudomonas sp. Irchel 3A5]|uniref:hypothetical protein n=1 Tax=Pseudomonas sp. Irchel 3A5 TaxID=2008911 RepID=UPI0011402BE5|nr:hypothetical protein [Pseudomonas sp. Irchel 3A5]
MSKGMQHSYVNAGGLFFFSEYVSPSFEDDTLASHLAFQLGASSRHNKFNEGAPWRQAYMNALATFGSRTSRRDVLNIPLQEQGSVWGLVKQGLNRRVSQALIQQAEQTLMHLQDGSADGFGFFRQCSTDSLQVEQSDESQLNPSSPSSEAASTVSFQLAFVDSEPLMTLVFISFKATSQVTGLPFAQLFDQGHITGNVELTLISTELDDHHYARFRDGLLKKLGHLRQELIFKLSGASHED